MKHLDGKVALVTGASRGIGRAIALRLAADGAQVVVNYASDAAAARASVADIAAAGGKALAVQADIAKVEDIRRLFDTSVEHFGRLDILVANAGHAVFKPLCEITEQDFDRTYAVNARGTFFCMQEALRHLGEGGRIVCISTIGTLLNLPGGACYFGAKAAVEQFCRVAAREVAARGITINSVSPGFIDTDMHAWHAGPGRPRCDRCLDRYGAAGAARRRTRYCRCSVVSGRARCGLDDPSESGGRWRHHQSLNRVPRFSMCE